jgi:flagellar protein FlaJ
MRIALMILPQKTARRVGGKLGFISDRIVGFMPELRSDLLLSDVDMTAEEYAGGSVVSALLFGLFMLASVTFSLSLWEEPIGNMYLLAAIPAVLLALADFLILLHYPKILARKRAEYIERDLVFALRELLLNMSAGLSIYDSIRKVAEGNFGYVSEDFSFVINKTLEGVPLEDALESLVLKCSSEHMRNTLWQIINALRSGSSVREALTLIINTLLMEQKRKISHYTQELNMMSMFYMLFAVAIPTIISTVLIVLTSLMGTGVTPETFILVVVFCILVQIILVGFIKSRRPLLYTD